MGPIQQGINQSIRSVGVAVGAVKANKVANSMISQANDATKNEMMAQKAKLNAERLKKLKLQTRQLKMQNKTLRDKLKQGGSK